MTDTRVETEARSGTPWTPGPWRTAHPSPWSVEHDNAYNLAWIGIKAKKKVVAVTVTTKHHDDPEYDANARLIAAAPDLYEAVNIMLTGFEPYVDSMPKKAACMIARAALARARGEQS